MCVIILPQLLCYVRRQCYLVAGNICIIGKVREIEPTNFISRRVFLYVMNVSNCLLVKGTIVYV